MLSTAVLFAHPLSAGLFAYDTPITFQGTLQEWVNFSGLSVFIKNPESTHPYGRLIITRDTEKTAQLKKGVDKYGEDFTRFRWQSLFHLLALAYQMQFEAFDSLEISFHPLTNQHQAYFQFRLSNASQSTEIKTWTVYLPGLTVESPPESTLWNRVQVLLNPRTLLAANLALHEALITHKEEETQQRHISLQAPWVSPYALVPYPPTWDSGFHVGNVLHPYGFRQFKSQQQSYFFGYHPYPWLKLSYTHRGHTQQKKTLITEIMALPDMLPAAIEPIERDEDGLVYQISYSEHCFYDPANHLLIWHDRHAPVQKPVQQKEEEKNDIAEESATESEPDEQADQISDILTAMRKGETLPERIQSLYQHIQTVEPDQPHVYLGFADSEVGQEPTIKQEHKQKRSSRRTGQTSTPHDWKQLGCYAKQKLKPNQTISIPALLMPQSSRQNRSKVPKGMTPFVTTFGTENYLLPSRFIFLRHASEKEQANVALKAIESADASTPRITLKPTRTITPGNQLMMNYLEKSP
ncbi:hypothetical protein [Parendozoicomonas haliclonae]|uniref:Uncharacterized protein n=1 Tax=Parendozoicomonas haliclonae TaxID=1960125 RepID=A0A1X7AGL1_9GAMM|nr:hypothetical protein [Parendozoicomonas haliclonae]SMA39105.1 hypothetical protein EHSB41UT_00971 [Parendozoicomonas haliclonae]